MAIPIDESTAPFKYGIRTPQQLIERCKLLGSAGYLIEGLIPRQGLTLFVGDSGLGKSPLMYQAGMCVAAGLPFLGRPVRQGAVIYLDCENGLAQVERIVTQLARFLELPAPPENLLLWNLNDNEGYASLEALIDEAKPSLVIVDPLNAFYNDIESKSETVTKAYHEMREIMKKHRCSIVGVHHLKKPGEDAIGLESSNVREWFLQARGSRALINGCDVRIGLDRPSSTRDGTDLIVRGFERVGGEFPTIRLARVLDVDGEPLGCKQLHGLDLLIADDRAAYDRLGSWFRFKDAIAACAKGPEATQGFLGRCESAGVLRKLAGKLGYEKVTPPAVSGSSPAAKAA